MTKQETNNTFKNRISPVMDSIRKQHPFMTADMYFVSVVSQLRKNGVQLDNDLVNMMLDKMAKDRMATSSWQYIKGKIADGNLVKTASDLVNGKHTGSIEEEVARRAELMYKPSKFEQTVASIGTAGFDVASTAPIALLCPSSVVYGALIQGGYDIVNNSILLPESSEERVKQAKNAQSRINTLDAQSSNTVPLWMKKQNGFTDYSKATDAQLKSAKTWADKNKTTFNSFYEKLNRDKKDTILVGNKAYTKSGTFNRAQQYEHFSKECESELNARARAKAEAEREARLVAKAEESSNSSLNSQNSEQSETNETSNSQGLFGSDPWGSLLNTLGFNGIGRVGKHLGYTLARLPDTLFGVFMGKSKSLGMNADTLVPLASLFGSRFVRNPILKMAMIGYGGINLANKLGNETLDKAVAQGKTSLSKGTESNTQYKQYADEVLNTRIKNLHLDGNRLFADIDNVPYSILLPETAVKAYQAGSLPLNTLANAVLQKSDAMQKINQDNYDEKQSQFKQNNLSIK